MIIRDYSILKDGDTVVFMITGNVFQYKGKVIRRIGYQGHPELAVTHSRSSIHADWKPDESWKDQPLKGDDYIITDKIEN